MKIIINLPDLLHDDTGAARIFTTDGKPTYACGAKVCYHIKELGCYLPVALCVEIKR